MRKITTLLALALATMTTLTFTGCKTAPTDQQVQTGVGLLRIAAKQGALFAITKEPKTKAYFTTATQAVNVLIANGNYDSAALKTALNNITINEIRDNVQVKSVIEDVVTLYSQTYASTMAAKLDQVKYLKPALAALAEGFSSALSATN